MQIPWSIACVLDPIFLSHGSMVDIFYSNLLQMSGVVPPPLCRNVQPNGSNMNSLSVENSPRSTVNSTIQAPRRKFVDEGKLRKVGELLVTSLVLSASFASLNKLTSLSGFFCL